MPRNPALFRRARIIRGLVIATSLSLVVSIGGQADAVTAPVALADNSGGQVVTQRPDVVSARLAAAAQGSPVEVTSLEDEYSDTYANPDGSLTADRSLTPLRVMQNGAWVDVDYDLQHVDGGWSPIASPIPVTFSDGDDSDAAAFGTGSHEVDLSWDVTLPKPTVNGPTASYDLGDGETLELTATADGFEQSLVLGHAPSTAPDLKLPFDTTGLSLSSDDDGTFDFVDSAGTTVDTIPAPTMYGSQIDPDTGLPQSHPVAASLTQTDSGARLDLTPSMTWLTDPSTVYPVTIDPSVNHVGGGADTFVQDNISSTEGSSWYLRAGMYGGSHAARSYLRWTNVSNYAGDDIESATLNLYNYDANNCTAATIHAYPLTQAFATSSTTWSSKPTYTTTDGKTISSFAANGNPCANAPETVDLTAMVTDWANGTLTNDGVQLSGAETSGSQYWGFCAMNYSGAPSGYACANNANMPTLSITYNSLPGTAAVPTMAPTFWTSGSGTPYGNTTTPTFTTKAGDPDGGKLQYNFRVYADSSGSVGAQVGFVNTGSTPTVNAGSKGSATLPSGELSTGRNYYFVRARAWDGIDYGPWSDYQLILVDTAAPAAPTVTAGTWTNNGWSTTRTDTLSFSDSSGDINGYSWKLDNGNWSTLSSATSHTFSNLTAGGASHTIDVRATDNAGNVSSTTAFVINIGTGGLATPVEGSSTNSTVVLSANGPTSTPYVYYQWREGTSTWSNIPASDVTQTGTSTHPSGSPWVVNTLSGGVPQQWTWNIANTAGADGNVQVQACLSASSSGSSPVCQPTPTDVQLSEGSFDDGDATSDLGPGTLSLNTGDYEVDASDVSVAAYNGGLSLGRSLTTLSPAGASNGATGVFGPAWTASLDGPDAGDAGETPTVAADDSAITFTAADSGQSTYTATSSLTGSSITYSGVGDAADGTVVTLTPGTSIIMDTADGTVTTWTKVSGLWVPASVVQAGSSAANTSSYYYNTSGATAGLPARIVAPSPSGVDCTSQTKADTTEGCRSLTFAYTSITVGGSTVERLSGISLVAWKPSASAMATTQLAAYDYNSGGQLIDEYDPRISPNLLTSYTYNSNDRLATLTPPGEAAWSFHYDSSGRLSSVTRPDPSGSTATQTVVYNLPLSGVSGLPDLSASATSSWGQTDDQPSAGSATAIFNPEHVPAGTTVATVAASDWPYAAITYMDSDSQDVDDAAYGAGAWQIDSTQYDQYGNTIWSLTAGNRAQALNPTAETDPYVASLSDSAQRADLLATVDTYSTDGSELLDEQGPMHAVTLDNGTDVDARTHTVTTYDQGAPNGDDDIMQNPDGTTTDMGAYELPTSETISALDSAGTDDDAQTTTSGYNPIDGSSATGDTSGWTLGTPTASVDPGGLTTNAVYDSEGRTVKQELPGDSGTGGGDGPRTTLSTYFTASGSGSCVDASEAGLLCQTGPAGQPASGDPLPVTSYTYNMYGSVNTKTETYGTGPNQVVRTTTTGYDAADRETSSSVVVAPTSAGGTALPTVNFGYSNSKGLLTTASTTANGTTATLTSSYDSVGRQASYTDANGTVSTYGYDLAGNLTSRDDGLDTTTYTVDSSAEHRGLVTAENIGVAGSPSTFTASYDDNGNLISESYPNGLTATTTYNSAQQITGLNYSMNGTSWLDFAQSINAQGQIITQSSPESSQKFAYDGSDRLTSVEDTVESPSDSMTCTTRKYTFDADSNRTALNVYPDAGDNPASGDCTTATTPNNFSYNYDSADRITTDNAGSYAYDALGRATAIPADDASGTGENADVTGNATVSYYANDMVESIAQDGANDTFTLDPMQDRALTEQTDGGTLTNHFSDYSDDPTWQSSSAATQEYVSGIGNGLAAVSSSTQGVLLLLSDLHGNIVSTVSDTTSATAPLDYQEYYEYGAPRTTTGDIDPYGWLGAQQRSSDCLAGLILMGARLYAPSVGRFESVDSIPGGNDNLYNYPDDPVDATDISGQTMWTTDIWGNLIQLGERSHTKIWTKHQLAAHIVLQGIAIATHREQQNGPGSGRWRYNFRAILETCTMGVFCDDTTVQIRAVVQWPKSNEPGKYPFIVTAFCRGYTICPSWVNLAVPSE